MTNLRRILILFFVVFFLVIGTIALCHIHFEGEIEHNDKNHCSICSFVFTISNAIVIVFVFLLVFTALKEQVIKKVLSPAKRSVFLPPSLAPPVAA